MLRSVNSVVPISCAGFGFRWNMVQSMASLMQFETFEVQHLLLH